jgi:hypothetical protein
MAFEEDELNVGEEEDLEADGPVTKPGIPAPDAVEERKAEPDVWAAQMFPPSERGRQHDDLWKHAAASSLHGWAEHAHHSGAPFQLTLEQYMGALEAATNPTSGIPMYQPSEAALSPHASYLKTRG